MQSSRARMARPSIHTTTIAFAAIALSAIAVGCSGASDTLSLAASSPPVVESPEVLAQVARAKAIFGVLPTSAENPANPPNDAKLELGKLLYFDPRLSKNHDISCNSCHQLDNFGVDNEPTSPGHKGQRGGRNSPTSFNAALHFRQFWDGREPDVEAQARGPVLNPIEMAHVSRESVEATIASIPAYPPLFQEAFPGEAKPLSFDNMANAIGAFERLLLTPSPFDRFMGGDVAAITEQQLRGYQAFQATGCIGCHNGPVLGGRTYQKLGAVNPYDTADEGRMEVTGREEDRGFFKVPSLRNVARTGPYFHDGSIETLGEAVRLMAWHQLGQQLDQPQIDDIVAFLESLTGELPAELAEAPELPASGPKTPAPDPT